MKIALIVVAIVLVILLGFGAKFVSIHNQLAVQQEAVKAQWADVDVVLQRRADLIPNLVNTVKGFAAHETEVYKSIADARAALISGRTPQDKIAANDQVGLIETANGGTAFFDEIGEL